MDKNTKENAEKLARVVADAEETSVFGALKSQINQLQSELNRVQQPNQEQVEPQAYN
ncbi:hypothetical protein [Metabacillus sp. Hm71]|uniref:hypothetical protein n=1 Tax=Metabacillus sp. Hm71 TaxID=3450743 RepID=UPI003F43E112